MVQCGFDLKVVCVFTVIMLHILDFIQVLDEFVYELGREETDRWTREKIDALKLTTEEWSRAEIFIDLLKVCVHRLGYDIDL